MGSGIRGPIRAFMISSSKGTKSSPQRAPRLTDPVEEFKSNHRALGFDEAKVGGTFIKIGVGVLRKDSDTYDAFKQYELVDGGKWTVNTRPDSVEFTHETRRPHHGLRLHLSQDRAPDPGKTGDGARTPFEKHRPAAHP